MLPFTPGVPHTRVSYPTGRQPRQWPTRDEKSAWQQAVHTAVVHAPHAAHVAPPLSSFGGAGDVVAGVVVGENGAGMGAQSGGGQRRGPEGVGGHAGEVSCGEMWQHLGLDGPVVYPGTFGVSILKMLFNK